MPGQVGQWGPVAPWPVVGIHVALLPNGKVLAFDTVGDAATETFPVHNFTRATVYDPVTGTHTPATVDQGHNIFCAGFAHLFDGSLFVAGGNRNAQLQGIVQTHLFNPAGNVWSLGPNMAAGRWYPSVTPLTNGEMLITEGGPDTPEVRRTDGTLRALSTASLNLPLYPWLDVAPDGRVFYSGPNQTMRKLDPTGGGAWQTFGQRDAINRDYGSHAVYDVGKTLVAGGGASSSSALVIDTNAGATPQVSATSPMAFGRRQHNLTLLADGSVLATGGNSTGAGLIDMNGGVYNAERWDPATGQWTTLAAQAVTRQYHSTALLLPDGRVLSSGGGICGTCDQVGYLAKNAEVFTPPYLFKKDGSGQLAPRPQVTSAPGSVSHGASFQITTPDAASISKVGLIRLGSQTHSVEMEQRYLPLSFTAGAGTLTASVPANMHTAVPGLYMLFIVDSAGVPSVARMVVVDSATPDTQAPTDPTGLSATAVSASQINLSWTASTDNVTVTGYRVERCQGATCTTFVQVATPTGTTYNDIGLTTATTYRYRVRAADAAGNLSGYTAIQSATTADTQAPTDPTSLSATAVSGTQINLAWTGSTDNVAVANYRVERCQGAACSTFVQVGTPTGTSYNDVGLTTATTYRYRVRAADAAGNLSGYTAEQSATTPDTQAPTAPTGLTATAASQSQIDLAWTASSDNVAVAGYRVERCQGATCTNFVQVATPTAASYSDVGLVAATTYRYRVRAADTAGNLSGYSAIQSATTPDTQAPTVPSGLAATAVSESQINLGWAASTDNTGVSGYRVERCQGAGCSDFVQVATPTGAALNDTGLLAATSYSYRVRAADAAGNLSDYSSVQSATTQAAGLCLRSSAVWLTGIEHGVVSTAGGGIFSSLTGTPTADNTVVRSGAYSLRIADASNASTVRALRSVTASSVVVARFAVRLSLAAHSDLELGVHRFGHRSALQVQRELSAAPAGSRGPRPRRRRPRSAPRPGT